MAIERLQDAGLSMALDSKGRGFCYMSRLFQRVGDKVGKIIEDSKVLYDTTRGIQGVLAHILIQSCKFQNAASKR